MDNSKFYVSLAVIIMVGFPALTFSQTPSQLFQQGLLKENGEGDLQGAVAIYQEIVGNEETERSIRAKALLHIGMCYEKLGKQEAQTAYERVIEEFAEQYEAVAEARVRLLKLQQSAKAIDASGIIVRQVWSGPDSEVDPWTGALSPDGRVLSYVHWETGNLALHDLTTGENRDLTSEGGYSDCSQYGWESVWSPDGKQLAYHWFNCDEEPPFHSLRLIRVDGSVPRVLLRAEEVDWPAPVAWTPDGSHIVALLGKTDRTWQIALVAVADGSVRLLKTLDWRRPERVSLSPDGRYLVYDLPMTPTAESRDLFILAVDGSRETPLVEHPANDRQPVWVPGGGAVVFISDRTGTLALWHLVVSEGRPVDEPQLIKADVGGIAAVRFAPSGAFYYGTEVGGWNVWSVDFDTATATVVGELTLATTSFTGWNQSPEWSPDGRNLAYLSARGPTGTSPGHKRLTLVIRNVTTGKERTLSPNFAFRMTGLRWSPDGRSLLALGKDDRGRPGIHSINVQDGSIAPLVIGKGIGPQAEWLSDGSSVVFHRVDTEGSARIMVRDFSSGEEHPLVSGERVGMFALSPDGRTLVYARTVQGKNGKRELMLLPLSGGEARSLTGTLEIRGPFWWDPRFIEWTPDGRHLLFGTLVNPDRQGESHRQELWKVSVDGGEPELVAILPVERVCDLRIAPGGKRLVFDDCAPGTQELWVMENFLPELKTAQQE